MLWFWQKTRLKSRKKHVPLACGYGSNLSPKMNGFESIEMTWNDNFWRVHRYRNFDPSPDAEFRSNLKIWHWIKGKLKAESAIFYGKIYGFRLKFSLKPIHWIWHWSDFSTWTPPKFWSFWFAHAQDRASRSCGRVSEGRRAVIGYPVGFERAYSTRIYNDLPQCMLFPCIYFQNNWRVGTGH